VRLRPRGRPPRGRAGGAVGGRRHGRGGRSGPAARVHRAPVQPEPAAGGEDPDARLFEGLPVAPDHPPAPPPPGIPPAVPPVPPPNTDSPLVDAAPPSPGASLDGVAGP